MAANEVPFAKVNVCPASVYTGTSSTVALNSSVRLAVLAKSCVSVKLVLPSLTKTPTFCTGLTSVPAFDPVSDIMETLSSS